MVVFQGGHDFMSWRDMVRWEGNRTGRDSPDWGSSILRAVAEWRLLRGDKWSMSDGRRGDWRVLDHDKFLNITIEISYELLVFLFELNQMRPNTHVDLFWGVKNKSFGTPSLSYFLSTNKKPNLWLLLENWLFVFLYCWFWTVSFLMFSESERGCGSREGRTGILQNQCVLDV